ncbi:hypothetical protein SEA_ANNADREAMY_164 [Streptomyces phage Annadreamy]|uniref:Uncharacterized protein n=2 Tax=Annadreamyvirus annadreamy TaxID=2846392 RepID=A0A345GTI3_9CAUD|nr:hypothetical protein HWB75_gp108 [Streptomyces phage Annadreamy]AXG66255.1 hypothetical protein SEA_ANNADREAMY_164 [Streptomyces phage Annadreamy]QGH79478.1 hypothetical protein SEA_LIMPID_171 [Streptomyces phage Limpid]
MSESVVCACCGRQHNELRAQNSRLIAGNKFFACPSCKADKKEPRAYVILVGRASGPDSVTDYILNRRYCGDEILAKELVTRR